MIAVYGDLHIDETSQEEILQIFDEIYFKKDYERVIFLGDCFNKKKPTPKEIDTFTWLITKMLKKGKVDIVKGNHEETSTIISALDYLAHLGVTIHQGESLVMLGNFKLGIGHFFVDKGEEYTRDEEHKVSELDKIYDLTLLGHNHKFVKYTDKVYHLGSVRRKSFNEIEYGQPKYAEICPESSTFSFCEIKSAIPMSEVILVKKALEMDSRAKIQLKFTSFEDYLKNVNVLPKLKKKFVAFKVKHDYKQSVKKKEVKTKNKSFEEIFNKFLSEHVKNKEVKKVIEENL